MSLWQRISRILLIMVLVPMIAAAGLPLNACQCSAPTSELVCASNHEAGASCCGEGRCACRSATKSSAEEATFDCCGKASNRAGEKRDQFPSVAQVSCQCASEQAPQPTVPASPSLEVVSPFAVPATLAVVAPLPPVVTSSCERSFATLLPSDDLPTLLCTLLI
jgi:hypothetical protein